MIIKSLPEGDRGDCGSGLFTSPLGRLNPFFKFCKVHDLEYLISEQEYAKAVVEGNDKGRADSLERKVVADIDFFDGCMGRARESYLITRPFMIIWAKSYIKAVKTFSDKVWLGSTKGYIEKFKRAKAEGRALLEGPTTPFVKLEDRLFSY